MYTSEFDGTWIRTDNSGKLVFNGSSLERYSPIETRIAKLKIIKWVEENGAPHLSCTYEVSTDPETPVGSTETIPLKWNNTEKTEIAMGSAYDWIYIKQ